LSTAKRSRMAAPERREVIENAAIEVFAERGYLGASIDEISRRAGISAPVVYDHFSSKLDLYRRLLERTRNELLKMWRDHLFGDEPAEVVHGHRGVAPRSGEGRQSLHRCQIRFLARLPREAPPPRAICASKSCCWVAPQPA